MNKKEREVARKQLKQEREVLKKIRVAYADALKQIEDKIKVLQADELTQSKIYQIEHQKALKGQINAILDMLSMTQYDTIQDYLMICYESGFLGTMYDLQGQGIPLVIQINQDAVVKAIQLDSKISEGLYTRLGKDITQLKKDISKEVTRGVATASSFLDVARNLDSYAKININRAFRIARTEGHRVQQQSAYDAQKAAKQRGAKIYKQWDSTLDGRTRKTHRKLDGQLRELEDPFEIDGKKAMFPSDFGRPEEDINCRCVILQRASWAIDEEEFIKRDGDKNELVTIKSNSFEEFEKKYKKHTK